MKEAHGKLRDYLTELPEEDSADKKAARHMLGIDLKVLTENMTPESDQVRRITIGIWYA